MKRPQTKQVHVRRRLQQRHQDQLMLIIIRIKENQVLQNLVHLMWSEEQVEKQVLKRIVKLYLPDQHLEEVEEIYKNINYLVG